MKTIKHLIISVLCSVAGVFSVQASSAEAAGLATDFATTDKQFRAGVVVYLGDQIVPFGDKLWLVPMPVLWAP